MALKAPHVASRSPKPGLDLWESSYTRALVMMKEMESDGTNNNGCHRNNTPILLYEKFNTDCVKMG